MTTDLTTETSKNKTNDDRSQLQSHGRPTDYISMHLLQRIGKQGLQQKRLTTYGQRSYSDSGRNIDEGKLAETRDSTPQFQAVSCHFIGMSTSRYPYRIFDLYKFKSYHLISIFIGTKMVQNAKTC